MNEPIRKQVKALHEALASVIGSGSARPEDTALYVDCSVWLKAQDWPQHGHVFEAYRIDSSGVMGRKCCRCDVIEFTDRFDKSIGYVWHDRITGHWHVSGQLPACPPGKDA